VTDVEGAIDVCASSNPVAMRFSGRTILNLTGAFVIVVAAFLITMEVLNYWDAPPVAMKEPAYDAASLPRLSAGQTLDFSNGQNKRALLAGWSVPEPQGVWSAGHAAWVGFVVTGTDLPKQAIVRAMVYLVPGKLDEQRVQVWSGDKKLAEDGLKDKDAELTIPLSGVTIINGTPVILGFYLPDANSPQQVQNSPDPRVEALYVKSLQLTP
jgi:hypothetical protein